MAPSPVMCSILAALLSASAARAQADPVDFSRDVRPLLADRCFACHGPDAQTRKAGLRLDLKERAFAVLDSGDRAIVAGDPAASAFVQRITHPDPAERMPPAESGKTLSDAERALLVRWVEAGAAWEEHWAFQPVAETAPPAPTGATEWARNGIDLFVLDRLRAVGLEPAPVADRHTLLRRVTLDLTGLPPSPEEIAAFVADERPDAYERVVERLLESVHHAEHMARYWLDAARYGDTHGLHLDNYREMWPYRDHVVQAFAKNQPYDRFVVEQLAGDLLPAATLQQRVATGFVRAHVTTSEGGSIADEVHVRNVVDRVDTVGTVFLGLTVGCAACHDHKFDPISQREYYRLFAFLDDEDGEPLDGNAKAHPPVVAVPSADQRRRSTALRAERTVLDAELAAAVAAIDYVEPPAPPADARPSIETVWVDDELPAGADGLGGDFGWVDAPVKAGERAMARAGEGLHQHYFRDAHARLRIGADDVLFAHVWLDPTDPPREIMLQWNGDGAEDWEHRAFWGEDLIAWGEAGTASRRRIGDLPSTGRYVRLEVRAADVGLAPGAVVHGVACTQHGGRVIWDAIGIVSRVPQVAEDWVWVDDGVPAGATAQGDGEIWHWVTAADGVPVPHSGERALRRSAGDRLAQDFFTQASPPLRVRRGDRLFAYAWLDPDDPPAGIQLQFFAGNWEHRVRWGAQCHGGGREGAADHVAGPLPPAGEWVRLEVAIEDVGLAPGTAIEGQAFTQRGGTVYWDAAGVRGFGQHDDRHLRSFEAWLEVVTAGELPPELREAFAADARSDGQRAMLLEHWLRHVFVDARDVFAPLHDRLADLEARAAALEAEIPTTLVMAERATPREAHVLLRGEYDQKGEVVEPGTPAFLPPMADGLPRNRLGLAQWIVDPRHPLTARVAVNRFWQQVFGTGLVRTAEDFGNQGEPPSHPRLLDWLAREFVASGWNVRALMRMLVTSATYRQSSEVGPEAFRHDPHNRLLARGPRHRLDAEVIRDSALAIGGLLVEQVGGAPVKPPQPPGLWEAVGYVGSNTRTFVADESPDKVHRRSIYTFWKRTAPPPQMVMFDAPSRESCRVRRERTNTPLQALVLMNDPQFVECARALAERVLRAAGDDAHRADLAVLSVTGRPATPQDRADVLAIVTRQRAVFAEQPERARALIAVGAAPPDPELDPCELAAWTLAASLLLNLDEFVTKS